MFTTAASVFHSEHLILWIRDSKCGRLCSLYARNRKREKYPNTRYLIWMKLKLQHLRSSSSQCLEGSISWAALWKVRTTTCSSPHGSDVHAIPWQFCEEPHWLYRFISMMKNTLRQGAWRQISFGQSNPPQNVNTVWGTASIYAGNVQIKFTFSAHILKNI